MKPYLSLGEAIEAYLKKNGLTEEAAIQKVIAEWDVLMGKAIAQNTDKVWFANGIFYVRMTSPLWKNELQMARIKLKELLNRELGMELVQEVKIM